MARKGLRVGAVLAAALFLACGASALQRYPSRVVVAGASGRVGTRVVRTLLERTNSSVVALARSKDSKEALEAAISSSSATVRNAEGRLTTIKCDLRNEKEIKKAVSGAEAAIWCATGFSDGSSALQKLRGLVSLFSKRTVDIDGMATLAKCMREERARRGDAQPDFLDVVMCSSAGVTRPIWSEEKKAMYAGAADIPIVRLNPFSILDVKRGSETVLRESGCRYAILRPTGLNDKHPPGRPIISQGDVAVGRINRDDVAQILCALVAEPAALEKTVECMTVPGYPKYRSLAPALKRCLTDGEIAARGGELDPVALAREYALLQQLLPGEKGDAAALAMGQTY